jgi:hypothetical protein
MHLLSAELQFRLSVYPAEKAVSPAGGGAANTLYFDDIYANVSLFHLQINRHTAKIALEL